MGDEYFANLDHIESVENFKEGYESDAPCSSDSSGVDLKVLAVQGTLKSLLQHHSSKASILRCSAFFTEELWMEVCDTV